MRQTSASPLKPNSARAIATISAGDETGVNGDRGMAPPAASIVRWVGALFLAGIPVSCLGGFAPPAMQSLMSRRVGPDAQGQLQGALSSMRGIAVMLGPVFFAQVFATAVRTGGTRAAGAPMLLGAAMLAVGMVTAGLSQAKHAH